MFLAILMLSPAVSVLHTAECELRLVNFGSSPNNYKKSAQNIAVREFSPCSKTLSWLYKVKGINNINSTQS
jgi:hypothetical protein